MFKTAPLSSGFFLAAILGIVITIVYSVGGKISPTWSFALGLVFVLMFIAALISATHTPVDIQDAAEESVMAREKRAEKNTVLTPAPKIKRK
ncbi:hypothetical protein HN587_05655 [Candidatus Woesearchaeota archaeon]|jgi:hypothetical protein|nr:hypothetical protein [Candidatus Woesearchaeota archaeon]